jgi:hypothetical protein
LPTVINNLTKQAAYMHESVETFYKDNPDLVPYKTEVAKVLERLESENPGVSLNVLTARAANETRTIIGRLNSMPRRTQLPRLSELDANLGEL